MHQGHSLQNVGAGKEKMQHRGQQQLEAGWSFKFQVSSFDLTFESEHRCGFSWQQGQHAQPNGDCGEAGSAGQGVVAGFGPFLNLFGLCCFLCFETKSYMHIVWT